MLSHKPVWNNGGWMGALSRIRVFSQGSLREGRPSIISVCRWKGASDRQVRVPSSGGHSAGSSGRGSRLRSTRTAAGRKFFQRLSLPFSPALSHPFTRSARLSCPRPLRPGRSRKLGRTGVARRPALKPPWNFRLKRKGGPPDTGAGAFQECKCLKCYPKRALNTTTPTVFPWYHFCCSSIKFLKR